MLGPARAAGTGVSGPRAASVHLPARAGWPGSCGTPADRRPVLACPCSTRGRLAPALACLGSRQKHSLPDLPYDYGALEPHINAQIMELHHSKHHAAYVNNLNVTEDKYREALAKGGCQANGCSGCLALRNMCLLSLGAHVADADHRAGVLCSQGPLAQNEQLKE